MSTKKSSPGLEIHLKGLEKKTLGLLHKVSQFDLDLCALEQDLGIPEQLAVKLKSLDQCLQDVNELLDVIEIIPQISAGAGEMKEVLSSIKSPLHKAFKVSSDFDILVRPVRIAMAKLEIKITALDRELNSAVAKAQQFTALVDLTRQCIFRVPDGAAKDKLANEIDRNYGKVDTTAKQANKLLNLLMHSVDRITVEAKQIENRLKPLEAVSGPIDKIIDKLNIIMSPMRAVEDALSHIISVPYEGYSKYCRKWGIPYPCGWHKVYFRFTVKEIISDLSDVIEPVENLLNNEMKHFLGPVIKGLNLQSRLKTKLPSIPGLNSLHEKLEALLGNFTTLPEEVEELLKKTAQLEKKIDTIIEEYGQWQKMYETCNECV